MLDIELAILFPMIDCPLGGAGEDEPPSRGADRDRAVLAARIVRVFLQCLELSWSGRGEKGRGERGGRLAKQRRRPSLPPSPFPPLPLFPSTWSRLSATRGCSAVCQPTNAFWLSAFGWTLATRIRGQVQFLRRCAAGRSGKLDLSSFSASGMRLCIPCRAVERAAANAGGKDGTADGKRGTDPISGASMAARSGKSARPLFSELSVSWATTEITAEQLAGLCRADIIATEMAADGPAAVSLRGEPEFFAKPLAWGGHRAVRITGASERDSFSVGEHIDGVPD